MIYWQKKYEMIILNKSNMIIGNLNYDNAKVFINYRRIPELKELYSNYDFQSHTFVFITI